MRLILPDRTITIVLQNPRTINSLLHEMEIKPLEVIVCINGALVPEDTIVTEDDEVRIIRIAHGG